MNMHDFLEKLTPIDMKQLPQFLLARAMGALAGVFALQRPMCVPVHVGALPVASAHYLRDSWRA